MTEHRLITGGELHLTGPVGFVNFDDEGFTVRDVTAALSELEGDITVKINSGGGFAFDGIAIHSLLRQHDGKVTTVAQGIAASAASVIFMAGDDRVMAEGAILMIHDASGMTMGTEADHLTTAKMLGKLSNSLAGIYAGRTRRGNDVERAAMRDETWLDGADAVEAGFATEATEGDAVEASAFNYAIYMNAPDFLVKRAKEMAERFGREAAAMTAAPKQPQKDITMVDSPNPGAAQVAPAPEPKALTLASLKADHPELIDAMLAEFGTDSAKAESARIRECQAVFGLADASEATKALAFDGKSDAGAVALAVLADAQTKGKDHLADLAKAEAEINKAGLTAVPAATKIDAKPAPAATPDGWKAEFEASADLKAEFTSAENYAAYMTADAAGRVKTLRGKAAA